MQSSATDHEIIPPGFGRHPARGAGASRPDQCLGPDTGQGAVEVPTDGEWSTTDEGANWTKLDLPGSPYCPRATQLRDGRILIVGHIGGDDEYGKVDQTIVGQTLRLEVIPGPKR
jgi:hypothetical protein